MVELYVLTNSGINALIFDINERDTSIDDILENMFSILKVNYPNYPPEPLLQLPVGYSLAFFTDLIEIAPINRMTLRHIPLSSALIDSFSSVIECKYNYWDRSEFVVKRNDTNYTLLITEKEVKILTDYVKKLIDKNVQILQEKLHNVNDIRNKLEKIEDSLLQ